MADIFRFSGVPEAQRAGFSLRIVPDTKVLKFRDLTRPAPRLAGLFVSGLGGLHFLKSEKSTSLGARHEVLPANFH